MQIRLPTTDELHTVKELVDTYEELDVTEDTYQLEYFTRVLDEEIIYVADKEDTIIGVCFGTYNTDENWADLLAIVVEETHRKQGVASKLLAAFEHKVKELEIDTIDLFAEQAQEDLFTHKGYEKGRTYISFRKKLNK